MKLLKGFFTGAGYFILAAVFVLLAAAAVLLSGCGAIVVEDAETVRIGIAAAGLFT